MSWAHFVALCAGSDVVGEVEGQATGMKQEGVCEQMAEEWSVSLALFVVQEKNSHLH